MNRDELVAKRNAAEKQFDQLQTELNKLQGEYRAYTNLIEEFDTTQTDPATTITPQEEAPTDATNS